MSRSEQWLSGPSSGGLSRRGFLGAAGGVGLALMGWGDGGLSISDALAAEALSTPQRGGRLTLGAISEGAETVDGQMAFGPTDWARSYALYNGLARIDQQGQVRLWMAESIEPNKDATEWTIKIPPGITTHKGKPFTSKDVLFSLRRMVAKQTFGANAIAPKLIDLAGSKPLDKTTLRVKYKAPFSQLVEGLAVVWNVMVPEGFDPKRPDGTGPFMFKSFTSGQSSVFIRNPNYWESGKPYLDELVITTNLADETTQVNALQSGQVNLINALSAASINSLKAAGAKLYVANRTGWSMLFTMRMDKPPFNDVRIRQAFRLIVDRPAMLRAVFGGYGSIGNDIFNQDDPYYDTSIPQRRQDIDQAKSLLAKAGRSGMSVQLFTTPSASPGAISQAQLFATQASAAGVKVQVVQQTGAQYFSKSYGNVPFGMDFWMTLPYLVESGMAIGPQAAFNVTHQNDPKWNKLWGEALRTTNKRRQKELAHELQQIDHTRGGNIISMFAPEIDASSEKVMGIKPSRAATGPNAYYWPDVWIKS